MTNEEKAIMTFGMFAMCEAAQMLLAEQMNCTQAGIPNHLQNEAAMYYRQFADGLVKAYKGLQGFNDRVAAMYSEIGGISGAIKHDDLRRTANDIIRMYIDSRNYIHTEEDAVKWDAQLFNLASKGKEQLISSDKRNKYRLL